MKKLFALLLLTTLITGCERNGTSTPEPSASADQIAAKGISLQFVKSPDGNIELKWPTKDIFEKIGHPIQSGEKLRNLFPDQFPRKSPEATYAFHTRPSEEQGLYFQYFPADKQIRATLTEVDAKFKPIGLPPNVHTVSVDPRSNKDIVHKLPFRVNVIMPEKTDALYTLLTELVEKDGTVSDSIVYVYYVPGKFINAKLETDKKVYAPNDNLQLKITNHGPTNLAHGGRYDLEKKEQNGWVLLNGMKKATSIADVGYSAYTVGEFTQNIKLPDDLKPGTYRITKSVGADKTDYGIKLSVAFEVK
ncbi:hypothetical protein SD71_18925 [Cohnella kolymensis]|uniref:Bacterial Ig-like domain-containing protein n=1 Tax=Cohnella kolymensis TaxID=1590652 RepID=A0ABR5A0E7_9BACL|nr:immunoglobulin-like domain-containing protein [Cohnella kolymensis]KIL34549.1 hypothetical protein SD71_18925 [Cohnella kolymensis]